MSDETKQVQLGDILSTEQIEEVIRIITRPEADGTGHSKLLKAYLKPFTEELLAKGVVADYLAYWLSTNSTTLQQMAIRRN